MLHRELSMDMHKSTIVCVHKFLTSEYMHMQDFFQKDCWKHHPKPYADYMGMKQRQDEEIAASKKKLIPGMA